MSPALQPKVSFTPEQEQLNDDCQMLVSAVGNGRAGARAQIDGDRVVCRITPLVEEMFSRRGIRFTRIEPSEINPNILPLLELRDGTYPASVDLATLHTLVHMNVVDPVFDAILAADPASLDERTLNDDDQFRIMKIAAFCAEH